MENKLVGFLMFCVFLLICGSIAYHVYGCFNYNYVISANGHIYYSNTQPVIVNNCINIDGGVFCGNIIVQKLR